MDNLARRAAISAARTVETIAHRLGESGAAWSGRLYAAAELRLAAEEREDRLNDVWVRVQGTRYRLCRKRPAGWAPTREEVQRFVLDAQTVAELRADAAPVEAPAAPQSLARRVIPSSLAPRRCAIAAGGSHDMPHCNL